jgi:hypothetical protein
MNAHPGPADGAEGTLVAVGVYQLLAPLISGRTVVEVGPLLPDSQTRLERAGAGQVVSFTAEHPSLPMADGAADLILCLNGLPDNGSQGSDAWVTELRRILQPQGVLVVRAQRAADDPDGEALRVRLGRSFGRTDLVTENGFVGVSFFVSGTEDIAIGGDLDRLAARPTHQLLFCTVGEGGPAPLTESLLIPLDGLRAELARRMAWQKTLDADRDELREQVLALQERSDRTDATLAELRRRSARMLERSSDAQELLETLTLERDQAAERARRAEKAIIDLEAATRRREVEISALKSEIARLRARQPPRTASTSDAGAVRPSENPLAQPPQPQNAGKPPKAAPEGGR